MYFTLVKYYVVNICQDNPIFVGLDDYIRSYTTGSIAGARRLIENQSDIVINWSGGMHSAKKSEASGFSYVNDVVLAILELLKFVVCVESLTLAESSHASCTSISTSITETAWKKPSTRRVACSRCRSTSSATFSQEPAAHSYFLMRWSEKQDVGFGEGKGYAVNFPLDSGVDDADYLFVFKPVFVGEMSERVDRSEGCGSVSARSDCAAMRSGLAGRRPHWDV